MEGAPKFRAEKETPHGPILKRESSFDDGDDRELVEVENDSDVVELHFKKREAANEEVPEVRELDDKQVDGLRAALAEVKEKHGDEMTVEVKKKDK